MGCREQPSLYALEHLLCHLALKSHRWDGLSQGQGLLALRTNLEDSVLRDRSRKANGTYGSQEVSYYP